MSERIEKKLSQINKIERRIEKHGAKLTDEQKKMAMELKWSELSAYAGRDYDLQMAMDYYRSAVKDLATAKEQLEKIKVQEMAKTAKENTLANMPDAMKEFKQRMLDGWNSYDKGLRQFYRNKYDELIAKYPVNSIQGYKDFIKEYKYSAYEMMHMSDMEIESQNLKAIDQLIVNLLDRVIEKTGTIVDASGLIVTSGNNGYAVINGFIKGENGSCVVESISAGGYNIQRYHIRTLVK